MSKSLFSLIAVGLLASMSASEAATLYIHNYPGIITPSFRDLTNTDSGNTTYYGWGSGSFEGSTNDELIDNPATTLGVGGLTGTLNQVGPLDLLADSGNIYTLENGPSTLELGIVTNGVVGTGFTTIIIQGKTAFGGFNEDPIFSDIAGVTPTYNVSPNATGASQFWVQYQIEGNAANYLAEIVISTHTSLNALTVDTHWSSTGYADVTAVPEPSTYALVGLALVGGVLWRVRRARMAVKA